MLRAIFSASKAWMAKRPGGDLSLAGTDVIMNPSASHFAFEKFEVRKRFVLEGSRAFGVTYLYSNLVGNEAGRIIYDGGALIAADGKLVAAGSRLSSPRECICRQTPRWRTCSPEHPTRAVVRAQLFHVSRVKADCQRKSGQRKQSSEKSKQIT